jgi:hypothetical protein
MVAFAIVAFNSPMDEFAAFYRSKNLWAHEKESLTFISYTDSILRAYQYISKITERR